MAYDSVVLEPDIEVGGIDQLLNMQVCRRLMQASGQRPEVVVTYDLLPGTSGERDVEGRLVKMSKSRGNVVPVTAPPSEMFGATMSIPDETMWIWFRNLTEITPGDLGQLRERTSSGDVHPKAAKELLARVVVSTFHSDVPSAAHDAERTFSAKYGQHTGPVPADDILDVPVEDGETLRKALVRASGRSSSDLRRVASQRGLKLSPCLGGDVAVVEVADLDRPAAAFANSLIRVGRHLLVRLQVQV
jgi:tyrosyl-tRNA synthetase